MKAVGLWQPLFYTIIYATTDKNIHKQTYLEYKLSDYHRFACSKYYKRNRYGISRPCRGSGIRRLRLGRPVLYLPVHYLLWLQYRRADYYRTQKRGKKLCGNRPCHDAGPVLPDDPGDCSVRIILLLCRQYHAGHDLIGCDNLVPLHSLSYNMIFE